MSDISNSNESQSNQGTNDSVTAWLKEYPFFQRSLWVVGIISAIGIGSYLLYFNWEGRGEISPQTQDWGAFADFLALFFNILNSVVVAALTVVLYQAGIKRENKIQELQDKQEAERDKAQLQREKENRDFRTLRDRENREHEASYQTTLETPIIVFQVHAEPVINKFGQLTDYDFYWIIKNAGKGPALNVLVKAEGCAGWEGKAVKCYTILSRDTLKIPWIPSAYRIQARYNDIFRNIYTATTVDDETFVSKGDLIGQIEPNFIVRFEDALKLELRTRGF